MIKIKDLMADRRRLEYLLEYDRIILSEKWGEVQTAMEREDIDRLMKEDEVELWPEKDHETIEAQILKEEEKDTTSSLISTPDPNVKVRLPKMDHIKDPEYRKAIRSFLIDMAQRDYSPRLSEPQVRNARQLDKWVSDIERMDQHAKKQFKKRKKKT